ncbi:ACP S-malonyltransferase [Nocardia sp. NPDC057227]|uniref:ACP S-malonyltransferase n=1 Tax=Nocardia sp. NPDC057227 TaxID=3346056 RepID=UPI0036260CC1
MAETLVLGLFPGQGSQRPGMARWIEAEPVARELLRRADDILGIPLTELCVSGSAEELRDTRIAQPAILATSLALLAVLARRGWRPAAVTGHSLGEFTALAAAGAIDEESALRLVHRRGELMAEVSRQRGGAMSAIVGLAAARVEELCAEVQDGVVDIANYNQPTQTVVSGDAAAVDRVAELAVAAGAAKVVPLKVSGAFHSRLMAEVADRFGAELDRYPIGTPAMPVLSAVNGDYVRGPAEIRSVLRRQIVAPVRWVDTVRRAVRDGYGELVEIGPGQVLTGCSRRIVPEVPSRSIAAV